jgi:post-segregation antitoxin (ccd killing protein)
MSNKYIETLCAKPLEITFGYDANAQLSIAERAKVAAGILVPSRTAGLRWHYTKEGAYRLNNVPTPDEPKLNDYAWPLKAIGSVSSLAVNQVSVPPTSNKCAYYQGAIMLHGIRLAYADEILKKRANALVSYGDRATLDTSASAIQSAAKDVYKKIAFWLKGKYSSDDKTIKQVLRQIMNSSKLSEIKFAKSVSAESSHQFSDSLKHDAVMTRKASKIDKDIKKTAKARGLDKKRTRKVPFKNRTEGNAFRAWVNENRSGWAKKNKLDRSGSHDNSYIQKAWDVWGDAYTEDMTHKVFINRKHDNLSDAPKKPAPTPKAAPKPVQISNVSEPSLDLLAPIEDPYSVDTEDLGMIELLESDPAEFMKKYWYIPAGGIGSLLGLGLIVRMLRG